MPWGEGLGQGVRERRGPFEWPAIVPVFVPPMQPIIAAMTIDMLWFATPIAVNLQTAFPSPPVAMSAYYLKGIAPNWSLGDVYRGMGQFMVLQLIDLALCTIFPGIALWFPRWLFSKWPRLRRPWSPAAP
jgi:TRAP-type mannitol/chloroaromatic compound transport system permease large subunit